MNWKTLAVTAAGVIIGLLVYEFGIKKVFKLNSYEEYDAYEQLN